MARRQTEVLRNLDDSLRVLNFLTLRSCGFVVVAYGLCSAVELVLGLWSVLLGAWGFVVPLALAAMLACVLSWVEAHEDEHYVPSLAAYLLARHSRFAYGVWPAPPVARCRAAHLLAHSAWRREDA